VKFYITNKPMMVIDRIYCGRAGGLLAESWAQSLRTGEKARDRRLCSHRRDHSGSETM